MFTIAIIGARNRDSPKDLELTERAFLDIMTKIGIRKSECRIISGGAKEGGDRFAKLIAQKWGYAFNDKDYTPDFVNGRKGFPPGYDVRKYFERNDRIAKDANVLIAVVDPKRAKDKGGTNYTVNQFKARYPNGDLIIV